VKTYNFLIDKCLQTSRRQETGAKFPLQQLFFTFVTAYFIPAKHNQKPPSKSIINRPENPQIQH
jgi:hypothetical protein